jgi:hypothetical protein
MARKLPWVVPSTVKEEKKSRKEPVSKKPKTTERDDNSGSDLTIPSSPTGTPEPKPQDGTLSPVPPTEE